MSLRSLLTQTCTIKRWGTREPDDFGVVGPADYQPVKSNVPCLVQDRGATRTIRQGGHDFTFNAVGFFLPTEPIRPKASGGQNADRIHISDGRVYEVRGVEDEAGKGELLTVRLEAV